MNKLKLIFKNFQSITEGELEFDTGINFIIGQSNSGKTATFRALKTCLTNVVGSQRFIQYGKDKAEVTLEYNGNTITWNRTPKESSYIINGSPYIKTGRSNAFKILENETGFVEGKDCIMNIEEELQLPFPFGFSKTELFKLYENVFCVSDSAVILKSAKEHEDKVKSGINIIDLEISKNKTKLTELQDFKKEVDLNLLKRYLRKAQQTQKRLNELLIDLPLIKKALAVSNADLAVKDVTFKDKVHEYRELNSLSALFKKLRQLHALTKQFPAYNISSLDLTNYKELMQLKTVLRKVNSLSKITLPEITIEDKLSDYNVLVKLQNDLNTLKQLHSFTLPTYTVQDKLQKYKNLVSYKEEIKELLHKVEVKEKAKKEAEIKLSNVTGALKEFKVCPLCHSKLKE